MTRLVVLASFVAAGCVSSSEIGEPLAEHAYYVGVPTQYASADHCIADTTHPHTCSYALTLCANGRAALRIGDVVMQGIYAMHGSIARGTIEAKDLSLDIATLSEPEGPIVGGIRWEIDTEGRANTQIYATIRCDSTR